MSWWLWVLIGLALWTVVGVGYFCYTIGNKTMAEPWYGRVLLLPVLLVAYVIGWLGRR